MTRFFRPCVRPFPKFHRLLYVTFLFMFISNLFQFVPPFLGGSFRAPSKSKPVPTELDPGQLIAGQD